MAARTGTADSPSRRRKTAPVRQPAAPARRPQLRLSLRRRPPKIVFAAPSPSAKHVSQGSEIQPPSCVSRLAPMPTGLLARNNVNVKVVGCLSGPSGFDPGRHAAVRTSARLAGKRLRQRRQPIQRRCRQRAFGRSLERILELLRRRDPDQDRADGRLRERETRCRFGEVFGKAFRDQRLQAAGAGTSAS